VIWNSDTVFVLGAGFTKAFLPRAPLLVDDYGGHDLKTKFAGFPDALTVLEMEMGHPDHPLGWINLERLMTRLSGLMPYDFQTGAERPLGVLLSALKQSFIKRLSEAKESGKANEGELWLFAGHCLANRITCLTFNYDDLLDEALSNQGWNPDSGYGFPCQVSETLASDYVAPSEKAAPMQLLKLHGSVNWRIPMGRQRPYSLDAIKHHEPWFHRSARRFEHMGTGLPLDQIERYLEAEPFFVPPILTKTELVQEPILRLTWSLAMESLKRAKKVVFIGYSLPVTDIAAGFLFREGLRHLDHGAALTVIDFAVSESDRKKKLETLLTTYRNAFPGITPGQFELSGAAQWVRDNLTQWLYDSKGRPVAFDAAKHIVSRAGRFIGTIRGYYRGRQDVWHGIYKGEIVDGNRFLRVDPAPTEDRGGSAPPPLPQVPRIPDLVGPISLPPGHLDIDWADEGRLYAKPAGAAW
jgi:hypothetical protein